MFWRTNCWLDDAADLLLDGCVVLGERIRLAALGSTDEAEFELKRGAC